MDDRQDADLVEVTLRSANLHGGEFRAIEDRSERPKRRWGGQQIKDRLLPVLYWFLRKTPGPIALFPFYLIVGVAHLCSRLQRNPLRQSCEDISCVADRAGIRHDPQAVYRRFLRNVLDTAKGYRELLRTGSEGVIDRVDTRDVERAVSGFLKDERPFMLFVPHNLAAIFGGVALTRVLPLLIISRNSKTIRRTRLALDVYERINAQVLMVRGSNPFEVARAMYSALGDGNALVATVDNVDPGWGVPVQVFGQDVEFASWAAKIAAKRQVPVVPMFCHCESGGVRIVCGEPLVTSDATAAIQHYVRFFEQRILEDPASWAYLADRKWCRVLRRAAATTPAGNAA